MSLMGIGEFLLNNVAKNKRHHNLETRKHNIKNLTYLSRN